MWKKNETKQTKRTCDTCIRRDDDCCLSPFVHKIYVTPDTPACLEYKELTTSEGLGR